MIDLKPHQKKAVEKLSNGKILTGGVGSGKTFTALAYYYTKILGGVLGDLGSIKNNTPLYVFTTARKRDTLDWEKEAAALGLLTGEIVKITVDSWNNAPKYKDIKDSFVIWDEQRAVGSGVWAKTFIHINKSNQWIMLSATPGDNWFDFLPAFISNGFYKNRTEFKWEHVVYNSYAKFPKVDRYINVNKLVRLRDQLLVEMPYERHTTRYLNTVDVAYNEHDFNRVVKDRWHILEDRPIREVAEMFALMRRVTNTDPERIERVRELVRTHDRVIVFYNFDYELEMLRSLGDEFIFAEWNGHKHEPIPDTDRWIYLVQYAAGAEGWNCTDTNVMIFFSLTYSYKHFEQAQGRIDRLNTPYFDLYYYILLSDSFIDKAIAKALKEKKSFNEADFVKKLAKNDDFRP